MLMAHEAGDIPVARAFFEHHAGERKEIIRDLLDVWAAAMADENIRKKAQEQLFGLKPADGRR
jgi:hypothetical protein